jgi:hypothetical protein
MVRNPRYRHFLAYSSHAPIKSLSIRREPSTINVKYCFDRFFFFVCLNIAFFLTLSIFNALETMVKPRFKEYVESVEQKNDLKTC